MKVHGHCALLPSGAYDSAENVRISGHYAADLRSELTLKGFTTTVQVLIDDKRIAHFKAAVREKCSNPRGS
jgi:hypothetical protein